MMTNRRLSLGLVLAALAGGCTDSDREPGSGVTEGPAFLLGTRIWDDVATTSYFHVVPDLDAGTEVDLDRALETPGAAKVYAVEGLGWFAIGGGEEPTITRYTLDKDGNLVEGLGISLADYGVESLWDTLYVVSPTKAYYPDRDGSQLIIWNPTEMEVTGTIALPETVREGYLSLYGYTPVVHGETLFFSVGWFDWEESDSVLPETGLVAIDTRTDTVEKFEVDARCGGITQAFVTNEKDAYFISSAMAGAAYRLGRLSSEPCALRLLAGDSTFDADYSQVLGELTGGALAGEPAPGGDGAVLLRVFDEELATFGADAATWELTGQSAWRWSRWDLETNEVSSIDALDPSTADVLWFEVDGKVYGTETTEDYSETTLIELTAEGGPREALTTPGFLHGVARIR